jgi:site-specific recombinase XerD
MLNCRLKDIHLNCTDLYVWITGKGNKTRVVPLTEETISNIKTYMNIFHKNSSVESFLIFTIHDHMMHKMSEDNVQRIVKKYADMARMEDKNFPVLHPHMLKHSFGAIMYRNNMSRAEIAKLMGHEQESTTEIYVETDSNMIRASMMKLNESQPEEKFKDLDEKDRQKIMQIHNK